MTIHQLLRILAARKWWIALSIVLVVAVAAAASQLLPKRYAATASVVVNVKGSDPLTLGSAAQSAAVSIATQMEIMKRPRVARRVVTDLHLDSDPGLKKAWEQSGATVPVDVWLARMIGSGLSISNGADSNVIDLIYTSRDPVQAARLANAFAQAYVSTTLELKIDPARQYVSFFDARIAELRGRLEQAQGRLSSFEKETGVVNAGGKLDVEMARMAELSSQLASAQAQQADSSSRQRGSQGNTAIAPEVIQNGPVQALKSQVASQQVKLKELSLRLGPNHPEFRRAEGELAEMQARLAEEIGRVTSSLGTAERISAGRVVEIQALLDAQRQRVLSLQEQRDRSDVLQKEVENAQRAFDLAMQRQSQITLESQAQQTDVSLLDSATVPGGPSWPNVPLILMMGLVAGLLLGVVLALTREFLSPVVRTNEDILLYTGLPVLAVIPSARLSSSRRFALPGWRHARGVLPA